ncbi:hypothetical protein CNR22_07070 [Sphingobacteriaceae bacterium]|nr:hypothetical protein CNR22_07070 [Sphingobacteriaceae bacterium]
MEKADFISHPSSGFFLQRNEPALNNLKEELIKSISENLYIIQYDQYSKYRYNEGFSASSYFLHRIKKLISANQGDWAFFYEFTASGPYIVGVRLSKWDEEHFGFKMANLQIFTNPNEKTTGAVKLGAIIKDALNYLKGEGVTFVSSRVNGDDISSLHSMEDKGFRYYDNVIWPISATKDKDFVSEVRLMKPDDVNEIKRIAENFQYQRGHYYCDDRFDKKVIDAMYPKWIETTIRNKEHIAIIESDQKVAGLFVFKMDEELEDFTGFKYGRLRLLALDSSYRGLGLGEKLFNGTLAIIKNLGGEYIDSGYSTKNHISAKLHAKASFFSVYEEVTFHLWLK